MKKKSDNDEVIEEYLQRVQRIENDTTISSN